MRFTIATACAALIAAATAGNAQTVQQPTAAPSKAAKAAVNPDKMVCRDLDTTGSRVNRKRDCRTARQWTEQNALDRQLLDRQQANRYKNN